MRISDWSSDVCSSDLGDRIVEERGRQIEMQPRAVAGLAVGIDRAAMPHRLQRIDRRLDDAPRRAPVGRGDEADAARVGFELGAVHALTGEAGALVDLSPVEGRSLVLSISRPAPPKARLPAYPPAFWPIVRTPAPAPALTYGTPLRWDKECHS